jgi:hypothetical protein
MLAITLWTGNFSLNDDPIVLYDRVDNFSNPLSSVIIDKVNFQNFKAQYASLAQCGSNYAIATNP